jgi:hypothetical protein
MRLSLFLFILGLAFRLSAQLALDDNFISERWVLNAGPSLLDHYGVDGTAMKDAEHIRTYALDEPYYCEKRIFLRIDPKDNPELFTTAPADSILPLNTIVNNAVAHGDLTLWKDLDYDGSDTLKNKEPVTAAPLILKIDFHIDTVTYQAVPHITGLSIERPSGGYAHLYYPELSYALRKYHVQTKQGPITCDDYFKRFLFKSTWISCEQVASEFACKPRQPSLEQQAELDALTELYLLDREVERVGLPRRGKRSLLLTDHPFGPVRATLVFDKTGNHADVTLKKEKHILTLLHLTDGLPDGPYRSFYPDGSLREEGQFAKGLRLGKWNSWFPNGNIRSHRVYVNGRLDGLQQVYYSNGQLWLEYGMVRGEYEGPHRTWYPDGGLKASGTMHEGFISGEWDYAIRIGKSLMEHLDTYNSTYYHLPDGVWQDGVLNYHVSVTDTGVPGKMNSCMMGHCIQWAYSEVR